MAKARATCKNGLKWQKRGLLLNMAQSGKKSGLLVKITKMARTRLTRSDGSKW